MKKNMVKVMLTTAAVAAVMIGGSKMEAKACYGSFLDNGVCVCGECFYDETGLDPVDNMEDYMVWVGIKDGCTEAEAKANVEEIMNLLCGVVSGEANLDITSHNGLLKLVNSDRTANGAGSLVWNADLEAVARQRAYEVYLNAQSAEYVNALNTGDYAAQAAIVHNGSREGIRENAIVSMYSGVAEATVNQNWIASAGHHAARIEAGYTQYACASYTDPFTGAETWVEVFADDNFKGSSTFDSVRYAADYPDLAAAFGNDNNALYNHYITNGINEGRKAYNTDGTVFVN